jgi:hypothetical protein
LKEKEDMESNYKNRLYKIEQDTITKYENKKLLFELEEKLNKK